MSALSSHTPLSCDIYHPSTRPLGPFSMNSGKSSQTLSLRTLLTYLILRVLEGPVSEIASAAFCRALNLPLAPVEGFDALRLGLLLGSFSAFPCRQRSTEVLWMSLCHCFPLSAVWDPRTSSRSLSVSLSFPLQSGIHEPASGLLRSLSPFLCSLGSTNLLQVFFGLPLLSFAVWDPRTFSRSPSVSLSFPLQSGIHEPPSGLLRSSR